MADVNVTLETTENLDVAVGEQPAVAVSVGEATEVGVAVGEEPNVAVTVEGSSEVDVVVGEGSEVAVSVGDATEVDVGIAAGAQTLCASPAGTVDDYWRGDRVWVALNVAAVAGLRPELDAKLDLAGGTMTGAIAASSDLILAPVTGIVKLFTSGVDGKFRAYDDGGTKYTEASHTGTVGKVLSSSGSLQLSSLNSSVLAILGDAAGAREFAVYSSGLARKAGIDSLGALDALSGDFSSGVTADLTGDVTGDLAGNVVGGTLSGTTLTTTGAVDLESATTHRIAINANTAIANFVDDWGDGNTTRVTVYRAGTIRILPRGERLEFTSDSTLSSPAANTIALGTDDALRIPGTITAAGPAAKYASLAVLDTDDMFHIAREDANILGLSVDMPLRVDNIITNSGTDLKILPTAATDITKIGSGEPWAWAGWTAAQSDSNEDVWVNGLVGSRTGFFTGYTGNAISGFYTSGGTTYLANNSTVAWQFSGTINHFSLPIYFTTGLASHLQARVNEYLILRLGDSVGVEHLSITNYADAEVAYIDSLGQGVFSSNVVVPKTSGYGIKVDTATPTFGWQDLLGVIRTRGVGATDPNDATYQGNIKGYQFAVNDEAWIEYHIPHDYVAGTDLYLHFHWSHNVTTVTGGAVTWAADVTYAKGFNQAAFPATVNPSIAGNASTTQYQHISTEVQISAASPSGTQIDSDNLEPDGVILARVYLSANNITVSEGGVPEPFLHYADIHYQSTSIGTKAKAPDFYA